MQRKKKTGTLLLVVALFLSLLTTAFAADEVTGVSFAVPNLFPGDSVVQEYTVTVRHRDPLTLYFGIKGFESDDKLAEALQVTVALPSEGVTIYDGTLRDIPEEGVSFVLPKGKNKMVYTVTVSLPTSAGNEYQTLGLTTEMLWWYEQESSGGGGGYVPGKPPVVKPENPKTGDRFSTPLYIGMGTAALCGIALLVLSKRKGGHHEY